MTAARIAAKIVMDNRADRATPSAPEIKREETMMRRLVMAGAVLLLGTCGTVQAQQAPKIYNTTKQKLLDGKQVVGGTVFSPDPAIYCAMANAGFDFLWIEMQHSPLTYQEVARMIFACRGSAGMPFIRVPDATESDIQKATDIGAIGVIVPTVDTVEKAEAAVKWTKYPPFGRRSQGGGQYRELWGNDYRQTANDNMMVVIMIETPEGVANAEKIAAVPGIDVIFAASTDLGNFSGHKQGEPAYEALVTRIKDATLARGIKLGGPLAWKDRPGFSFFQAPGEAVLINAGAQVILKNAPAPATR
jgi:2-keto-3-deoxy-L-rhamnonate aldolase RhmA